MCHQWSRRLQRLQQAPQCFSMTSVVCCDCATMRTSCSGPTCTGPTASGTLRRTYIACFAATATGSELGCHSDASSGLRPALHQLLLRNQELCALFALLCFDR
jgi:hypothetical protein